jgi:hypothetical protein
MLTIAHKPRNRNVGIRPIVAEYIMAHAFPIRREATCIAGNVMELFPLSSAVVIPGVLALG